MLSFFPVNDKSIPIAYIHNKKYDNVVYLSSEEDKQLGHTLNDLDDDDYIDPNVNYDDDNYDEDNYDDNNNKPVKEITLNDFSQRFSILPTDTELQRIYTAGPGGSGKSSIISVYSKIFQKMFPKKKIYLFSDLDHDEKLDNIKNIQRIPLNEDFLDNPIHPEQIGNSLVIFDDIDSAPKKILKEIEQLRDACLKRGRHEGILNIICSNHELSSYRSTRIVLSEATHIIVFANSGSNNSLNYLLKHYVGLNNSQITKVKKIKSRWCCFRVRFPQCLITEHQIIMLSEL